VGVAYKVAQALAARLPGVVQPEEMLDLVALGTVADVVPLVDENRSLVIEGLKRLRTTRRPGLLALFRAAGIDPAKIDPVSIGFYLAPRINAANRMASPRFAFDLITATDPDDAAELAEQLSEWNRQRQALVETQLALLLAELGDPVALAEAVLAGERPPVIVVQGEWPSGISGLLAAKLAESYGLPAFVGTRDGELVVVSARGTAHARIDELLEWCEASEPGGLFVGHGGHSRAGGFRIQADRWPLALAALQAQAGRQEIGGLGAVLEVDAEVALRQLDLRAAQGVRSLAPFGMEFPEPLFLARNVVLKAKRSFNGDRHVRVRLWQRGSTLSGIHFNAPPEFAQLPLESELDVLFHLTIDEWQGTLSVQAQIRDWRQVDR
jgi:single-stranded-DNA-specific exonuclease